jgi:GDP/UDP-N,N'-diacetylbacillosamine 2-epimerase (hydrolysing)
MRKICVITGTRAEYGLLYWTLRGIVSSAQLELQLCVTGMHLSPEFGLTYKKIEEDGFRIDEKLEMLLSSDSTVGITKSIGLGVIGFGEIFSRLCPDLILVVGDRFEIMAAVTAAMIGNFPVAHCHGGEATEGLIDESIRHAITKMSQIHFTSTETYKNRVIQLGEQPNRVFNVGALGIENINKLQLLNKSALEESINFKLGKINFLVTFHPVTLEKNTAEAQFKSLLRAIDRFADAHIIFTKPNADTDGRIIIQMIDEYVSANPYKAVAYVSLGQLRYLSTVQFVDAVIGNSSSGLIEVPSFKKATINIGDRQNGRVKAASVIDCTSDETSIVNAIHKALSPEFQSPLAHMVSPYGDRNSSDKIIEILETIDLEGILKKEFYNIAFA